MPIGEMFALGTAFCWGIGPLIAHAGVAQLGTFRFAMMRFGISALALGAIALATGEIAAINKEALVTLIASGVLGIAFGEVCLFQSIFLLGPRIASILFSLHAPITAFVGARLFQETASLREFLGIAIAVTGVSLAIIFRSASEKLGGQWHKAAHMPRGLLMVGGAIIFQVCGALLSKKAVIGIDPFLASFIRTASASVAFFPIFLMLRERDKNVTPATFKIALYSAGVSTIAGMTFLLAAFANTEIYKAVIIASLAPVVYILLRTLFARERFPLPAWIGTIMAVTGIAISL